MNFTLRVYDGSHTSADMETTVPSSRVERTPASRRGGDHARQIDHDRGSGGEPVVSVGAAPAPHGGAGPVDGADPAFRRLLRAQHRLLPAPPAQAEGWRGLAPSRRNL